MKKKKLLSLALVGVLLLCSVNSVAGATGNTATFSAEGLGSSEVKIEISNVIKVTTMLAKDVVTKYPLSKEQESEGDLYFTSDYMGRNVTVYECSSPCKIELKTWSNYFYAHYNELVNKDSIEIYSKSSVQYDEEFDEDIETFSAGTYFVLNESGTYVIEAGQIPISPLPFIVVVTGTNNTSNVTPSKPISNNTIKVMFKGSELKFTLPIINRDERTFYPMRELLESLGATVEWNGATKTAIGTLRDKRVEFDIGSDTYRVNGISHKMDTKAFIEGEKTYIPIRYACEGLGFAVKWDETTKTIAIGESVDVSNNGEKVMPMEVHDMLPNMVTKALPYEQCYMLDNIITFMRGTAYYEGTAEIKYVPEEKVQWVIIERDINGLMTKMTAGETAQAVTFNKTDEVYIIPLGVGFDWDIKN